MIPDPSQRAFDHRMRAVRDRVLMLALCWALIAAIMLFGFPLILGFPVPTWIVMMPVVFCVILLILSEIVFRWLAS